jgi:hypothetical protein
MVPRVKITGQIRTWNSNSRHYRGTSYLDPAH